GSRRWTTPALNCCSGSSPPPTNAGPWASPHTGRSNSGDGSYPNTSPPPACSTGSYTTPPLWSPKANPSACGRPAPEPQGVDHDLTWPKVGTFGDHQRGLSHGP